MPRRGVRPRVRWSGALPAALATLGALVLAACSSSPAGTSGPSVKIAVEAPFTGPEAAAGTDVLRGVELLASVKNHTGGVLGRQIQVLKFDDQGNPALATKVADNVVSQHPFALIGPFNSSVGVINLPIYRKAGIITLRLTNSALTNSYGYTVQPMDYQMAPLEVQAITNTLPAGGRVAIVYDYSTFSSGIAQLVRSSLTTEGMNVVAFDGFKAGQQDFMAILTAVKATNPDVVYYAAFDPEVIYLVTQARQLGMPGICLVNLLPEGFLADAGVAAQQCLVSGVPSVAEFPRSGGYIQEYQAVYHSQPGSSGAFSNDSLGLLLNAVVKEGAWDRSRVQTALSHTALFPGVTGDITIDPATGNRVDPPVAILSVRRGNFRVDAYWALYGKLNAPG